jgi:hypothetical protein
MKNTLRPLVLPLLLAATLPLSGCIAVAAGAAAGYGAHKISSNTAQREYPADVSRTWHATLASMREAGYPVGEGVAHSPEGGYVAVNDATVRVEYAGPTSTRVRLRLGTFDTANHRRRSDAILDSIGARLGTPVHVSPVAGPAPAPAPIPAPPPPSTPPAVVAPPPVAPAS